MRLLGYQVISNIEAIGNHKILRHAIVGTEHKQLKFNAHGLTSLVCSVLVVVNCVANGSKGAQDAYGYHGIFPGPLQEPSLGVIRSIVTHDRAK